MVKQKLDLHLFDQVRNATKDPIAHVSFASHLYEPWLPIQVPSYLVFKETDELHRYLGRQVRYLRHLPT